MPVTMPVASVSTYHTTSNAITEMLPMSHGFMYIRAERLATGSDACVLAALAMRTGEPAESGRRALRKLDQLDHAAFGREQVDDFRTTAAQHLRRTGRAVARRNHPAVRLVDVANLESEMGVTRVALAIGNSAAFGRVVLEQLEPEIVAHEHAPAHDRARQSDDFAERRLGAPIHLAFDFEAEHLDVEIACSIEVLHAHGGVVRTHDKIVHAALRAAHWAIVHVVASSRSRGTRSRSILTNGWWKVRRGAKLLLQSTQKAALWQTFATGRD